MGLKRSLRRWLSAWTLALVALALFAAPAFAQGGEVSKFVIGEDFVLEAGQQLDGGLVVVGGSASLKKDSQVLGDVFVAGGKVTVSGEVRGDMAVWGGNVRLTRSAIIKGDLITLGGEVLRDEGAQVEGSITGSSGRVNIPRMPNFWRSLVPFASAPAAASGLLGFVRWIFEGVFAALALGVLAVLLILFFEQRARQMGQTLTRTPWASLGMGALTLVAALAAALVLTITLCLIPLALLLLLALVVALLAGWAAAGLLVGERVLQALKARETSPLLATVLGAALLALVARLPCVGWLVGVVVGLAGLGALTLTRAGALPYPRELTPSLTPAAEPSLLDDVASAAPASTEPPAAGRPDEAES